jgi:tRNA (guanine37-N1)-methyltransferase
MATAIVALDLHDIARLACTYGLGGYWVVQPLRSQREIARRIVRYWTEGAGKRMNPDREIALRTLRIVADLGEILPFLENPFFIATSASPPAVTITLSETAQLLREGKRDLVLLLGTGWGLCPEVFVGADAILEPICPGRYNHLSVRSAASIYVDRLMNLFCAVEPTHVPPRRELC